MTQAAFNKTFLNPLLRRLDKEARTEIEKKSGQLLVLKDTEELEKVIEAVFPNIKVSKETLKNALMKGRVKAQKLEKLFKKRNIRRYNAVVSKLPDIGLPPDIYKRKGLDKNIFILSNFRSSIDIVKKEILKEVGKHFGSPLAQTIFALALSKELQKGHGVEGKAVSQAQIAGSTANLTTEQKNKLLSNLSTTVRTGGLSQVGYRKIEKLIVNGHQQVTKAGGLRAGYASVVTLQSGFENMGVAQVEEKALKRHFREFVKTLTPEVMGMEGSSTLEEKIVAMTLSNLSSKRMKVKSKVKNAKLKTSSKGKGKGKSNKESVSIAKGGTLLRTKKAKVKKDRASIVNLIGILSSKIKNTVAKNMGTGGRLVYRDGNFADSVEITDVVQTPQGFPSVGYTYALYPYQTFEPGYVQGSAERDPRKLIDASIREIAMNLAIGRFYTRRV